VLVFGSVDGGRHGCLTCGALPPLAKLLAKRSPQRHHSDDLWYAFHFFQRLDFKEVTSPGKIDNHHNPFVLQTIHFNTLGMMQWVEAFLWYVHGATFESILSFCVFLPPSPIILLFLIVALPPYCLFG
jgi:hypothetical protein